MENINKTKDSTLRRFMSQLKVPVRDLLRLRIADRRGNLSKKGIPGAFKKLLKRIRRIEKEDKCLHIKDLAINGNDLIAMGLTPSKFFSLSLNHCLNIVLEDPTKNTKEILLAEINRIKDVGVLQWTKE